MSSIQIPIQWSDTKGNLNPLSREAMYKIAELLSAQRPGILPDQFHFSPVTGTPFGALYLSSDGDVAGTAAMTNGQILIGRTGDIPVLNGLTGTANQITVTNGSGSITLSLPQNIGVTSSLTFADLKLSSLTVNGFMYAGTDGLLSTTSAPTNGQLLIGSTGLAPARAALTGTANQVVVTNGPGSITLSLPQNIHTGATPDFVGLVGTITNDSAATGVIGEYVESAVASGSAVALTTATPANVTSISLTAGDWDLFGFVGFLGNAATTATNYAGDIHTTSATLGTDYALLSLPSAITAGQQQIAIPVKRLSLAATTTVYLVASCTFLINTMGAYGRISARRTR